MFDIKEIIINRCANNIPGETQDGLLRIAIDLPEFRGIPKEGRITDYSKVESTVRFATLRYFSTQFVIHFVTFHDDMKLIYCNVLFLEGFSAKQSSKISQRKRNHCSFIEH